MCLSNLLFYIFLLICLGLLVYGLSIPVCAILSFVCYIIKYILGFMKNVISFLKKNWIWVIVAIALLILLFFGILWENNCFCCSKNTTEIFYYVSNSMTPIFTVGAVIAAFLTLQEQRIQNKLTEFENHLFQMIDQQHKLEERIIAKHGSFRDLYEQFCYIYEKTKEIMIVTKVEQEDGNEITVRKKIIEKIKGFGDKDDIREDEIKNEFKNKTLEIAYYIFYFGVDRDFVCDQTGNEFKKYFSDELTEKLFMKLNCPIGWFHNQKSEELGIYYRNLFNAIWYIDHKCPVDDQKKKDEYAKLVRTQISDFAQLMLYYNMQGERGEAWLKPNEIMESKGYFLREGVNIRDCLLTRYVPIKNCAISVDLEEIDPRHDSRDYLFSPKVIGYELKLQE